MNPPIEMVTGTAFPVAEPAGTIAFTWYSPIKPGVRPENTTSARAPPIDTAGVLVVNDSGLAGVRTPVAGRFVTAPKPVQKITTVLPGAAGFEESTSWFEPSTMTPWPVPPTVSVKIPGANAIRSTDCGWLVWPSTVTVTVVWDLPDNSQGIWIPNELPAT